MENCNLSLRNLLGSPTGRHTKIDLQSEPVSKRSSLSGCRSFCYDGSRVRPWPFRPRVNENCCLPSMGTEVLSRAIAQPQFFRIFESALPIKVLRKRWVAGHRAQLWFFWSWDTVSSSGHDIDRLPNVELDHDYSVSRM